MNTSKNFWFFSKVERENTTEKEIKTNIQKSVMNKVNNSEILVKQSLKKSTNGNLNVKNSWIRLNYYENN